LGGGCMEQAWSDKRARSGSRPIVGGLHVIRNGLAIKEIFIRSQHQGKFIGSDWEGNVLANRSSNQIQNNKAWTLEIFKVSERAEMEMKGSQELERTTLSIPGGAASSGSSDFLPLVSDDVDAMYYFGLKNHHGRYLGVKEKGNGANSMSQSPLLNIMACAHMEDPNFDCLWVLYQIRRGVWGLKSQRGDGPWLCVEGEKGELLLIDEPLPVDARFFWGLTTVRKKVKLQASHYKYLSAELNSSVTANRERAGPWEAWVAERVSSNKWAFLSYHGYYLSGLSDGSVIANQCLVRDTEQWELIKQEKNGLYELKNLHNRYLCLAPEKDGRVLTQAQSILKAKRLSEWKLQKDYQLRKITKTLIPLSIIADIPLPKKTASESLLCPPKPASLSRSRVGTHKARSEEDYPGIS